MSYIANRDFLLEVAKGKVQGHSLVHKFGRNNSIGASLTPVCGGGNYRTYTSAVSIDFISSDTQDALDDIGAHEITIIGLDANWDEQTVTTSAHATDGLTAVNVSGTWLRIYRAYVSKSGSYASQTTASHQGTITIRNQADASTIAVIALEGTFGLGQSQIGAYTVPAGYTAFILSTEFSSDVSGTKTTDFFFFQRDNANDVTGATYDGALRVQEIFIGTQNSFQEEHFSSEGYSEYTDIGFLAKATTTSDVSVAFELLLVDNTYL